MFTLVAQIAAPSNTALWSDAGKSLAIGGVAAILALVALWWNYRRIALVVALFTAIQLYRSLRYASDAMVGGWSLLLPFVVLALATAIWVGFEWRRQPGLASRFIRFGASARNHERIASPPGLKYPETGKTIALLTVICLADLAASGLMAWLGRWAILVFFGAVALPFAIWIGFEWRRQAKSVGCANKAPAPEP